MCQYTDSAIYVSDLLFSVLETQLVFLYYLNSLEVLCLNYFECVDFLFVVIFFITFFKLNIIPFLNCFYIFVDILLLVPLSEARLESALWKT